VAMMSTSVGRCLLPLRARDICTVAWGEPKNLQTALK